MSSVAQWVRAFIRILSWGIIGATSSSTAQSVRPSFGLRGFITAAGQKVDPNG